MKIIAKTFSGLEDILEEELRQLGAQNTRVSTRAVTFNADKAFLYKANYYSRLAITFLVQIADFKISGNEDLYDKAKQIEWDKYMNLDSTFSITSVSNSDLFSHSNYPGLLVKDGIADYFRSKTGERPNVDRKNPDITIDVLIMKNSCYISLNSSGEPLFKRGYRNGEHPAPINEVLAAGLIKLSGWRPDKTLHDPMCGSGTIPIEAAMLAYNIPAAKLRTEFNFMNWPNFDQELWKEIKKSQPPTTNETDIWASDIARKNIEITRTSLQQLGIGAKVQLFAHDFLRSTPVAEKGMIITNPPYGERLKTGNVGAFFTSMGRHLRGNYGGWSAWIISPEKDQTKLLHMKPKQDYRLLNGDIDCKFGEYNIHATEDNTQKKIDAPERKPVRKLRPRKPKI